MNINNHQNNLHKHQHQHHIRYLFKFIIFLLLIITAIIPIIYILGNQNVIIQNSLHYHPLFAYYDQYFSKSNITREMIIDKFSEIQSYEAIARHNNRNRQIQLSVDVGSKKLVKIDNLKQLLSNQQNIINLIGLGNQSRDIDNLAYAFQYVSFIANKQAKIIKKYLHSDSFLSLIQNEKRRIQKSLNQENQQKQKQDQEYEEGEGDKDKGQNNQIQRKLSQRIDQTEEEEKIKFSQNFLQFFHKSQSVEELAKKPILYNFKDYMDKQFQKLVKIITTQQKQQTKKTKKQSKKSKQLKNQKQPRYWIILYLNQKQNQRSTQNKQNQLLLKQLKTLTKRYPSDRFLIISLNPISGISQGRQIFLPKTSQEIFLNLLKSHMNVSDNQIKAIAQHYDYSLLELSKDVYNQQTFNLYDMVGGRLGYRNISLIKQKYQNILLKICQGNLSSSERHSSRQQQRINFYRIGLYEFNFRYSWKNKYVKMNYQFQTGISCPAIPAQGFSYSNIGDSLVKKYYKTIRRFFRKNIQKLITFLQIQEEEIQEDEDGLIQKSIKQSKQKQNKLFMKQSSKDNSNAKEQKKKTRQKSKSKQSSNNKQKSKTKKSKKQKQVEQLENSQNQKRKKDKEDKEYKEQEQHQIQRQRQHQHQHQHQHQQL